VTCVMKLKYRITLNKSGQVLTYYKWAHSSLQALQLAVRELERACGLQSGSLKNVYKDDNKNNREVVIWEK
jgi:ABC-type branched-subunit amino acid transport system substrate-binding protein